MDAIRILSTLALITWIVLPACAKTQRTLYTEDQIRTIRSNIEKYDWARGIRDGVVSSANKYLAIPDEEFAKWVPDPRIPRSIYVHETGCPNCGLAVRKHGNYSWIITPEKPYKVECPSCHSVYPSNDYQAFIDSGFQDRSLLTGDYPDDGWGWKSPEHGDHKFWFVGWYNHWMTQRRLLPAIRELANAYLYSEDPRYAHKCAVLLWQLAEYYPDYDYVNQSRIGTEFNRGYHGKLFYHTWENSTVQACGRAYDAIFPALLTADAELEALAGRSTEQIRHLIEEQLLRAMAREIVNETMAIAGNYGMHQMGLLQIAATLKDTPGEPGSEQMVDWILNNEQYNVYTMMPVYDALYNLVYRDGVPFESPGYNLGWVSQLTEIAEMLRANGVDLSEVPRFKKLYDWTIDIVCAGEFTPALGDSGNMSSRGKMWREALYLAAYRAYGDPLYARILSELNPNAGRDIAAEPIEERVAADAAKVTERPGYSNKHLAGYGLAILQNGNPESPVAASLFYGRFVGHSHLDKMHLDIFAENCSMMPDFGYPETANATDPRRAGFFAHTISHNTVMVDRSPQQGGRGRCLAYDPGPVCAYVEAANPNVYPQCEMYHRSLAMVNSSPTRSYFIDVFRVKGGTQHDWLVHGTHADFSSDLPLSAIRTQGTLAGPDVEYGHYYDDEELGAAPYGSVNYFGYRGSSFQFLYNVQEAPLRSGACARWDIITGGKRAAPLVRANDGAYLKAYMLGESEQVYVCDGKPQQNQAGTPESVRFVLRRRTGEDLSSTFVSVFEPGAGEELIAAVEALPTGSDDAVAVKVTLRSGEVDYYFNSPEPFEMDVDGIRFSGRVGYATIDGRGHVTRAYLYDATAIEKGRWELRSDPSARTTIATCDYSANSVTLSEPVLGTRYAHGSTVAIDLGGYGGSFEVRGTEGDNTLLFGDQDPLCSRAVISEVVPAERKLLTGTTLYFVQRGMHLLNERLEPVARVESYGSGAVVLDRPLAADALPDADGDGVVRAYFAEYGPGDIVTVPSSLRYEKR